MNKITSFLIGAALCSLFTAANPALAQGTAFTYQGQLQNNNSPVSGTFNLTFCLYTNSGGGTPIAGPVVTNGVSVTNGLFTVMVDFGAGPWNGETNWLEIAVETNGDNSFTTLAPRQQVTPTPYAIYATIASNLTGVISNSSLPTNIYVSGSITAAAFTGDGAGLTNVPASWQTVTGTSQLATANDAYLLDNQTQSTLTLPASPNVGDIVTVAGVGAGGWLVAPNTSQTISGALIPAGVIWTPQNSGSQQWTSVTCSADGTHMVAVGTFDGQIFTSSDSGMDWTAQPGAPATNWSSVASSSDGTKLVATINSGQIYTSGDSGVTWTLQNSAPSTNWSSVASSSDGTKLVATVVGGHIYSSTDSGVTWTLQSDSLPLDWTSIASSADGVKLVATAEDYSIFTSADSGVTWTGQNSGDQLWTCVASSSDGTHLLAGIQGGSLYTSSDSGFSWISRIDGFHDWTGIASSADGTRLVAVSSGPIYTSPDAGVTWAQQNGTSGNWVSVASSSDGTTLVAAYANSSIYTSTNLNFFPGAPGTTAQFQYIGNGTWQPLGPVAEMISPAQLPASVVTNTESGVTLDSLIVAGTNVIAPLTVPLSLHPAVVGSAAGLSGPESIAVAGRYAYVANFSGSLQIFDVSVATNPVSISSLSTGSGTYPYFVTVAGRYAYMGGLGDKLQIIDVGNPSAPVIVGSTNTAGQIDAMVVAGRYLYMADSSDVVQIFDVNDPANPVNVGNIANVEGSQAIAVSGHYAYVGSSGNNKFEVIDVGDPTNPTLAGSIASDPNIDSIAVSGRYAYIVSQGGSDLRIYDVSNPANPVSVGRFGGPNLNYPTCIEVQGRYAFVSDFAENNVQIFDVSDPTNPVNVGAASTGSANSVAVSGRYAYAPDINNDALRVVDLGGAYIQQMEAGSIETGSLQTRGTVTVGDSVDVRGGLTVSSSARISGGLGVGAGITVNTNVLYVGIDGTSVGIGTTNPAYTLQVNGSVAGVGAYVNLSDERLKTNITDLTHALEKIMALRGVEYDWRSNAFPELKFDDGRQLGFLAQQIKQVLPEVVSQDSQGRYSIAYSKVIPVVTEAIKEQQAEMERQMAEKDAQIQALRQQNSALAGRLDALEATVKSLSKSK